MSDCRIRRRSQAMRRRPECAGDDVRARAAELFRSGLGYRRAAAELKLPEMTVREWWRAFGKGKFQVELPKNCIVYDEAFKAYVVSLRLKGLSWSEIHRLTGVCSSTCRRWLNASGLIM